MSTSQVHYSPNLITNQSCGCHKYSKQGKETPNNKIICINYKNVFNDSYNSRHHLTATTIILAYNIHSQRYVIPPTIPVGLVVLSVVLEYS
jgi:hypothetical protein